MSLGTIRVKGLDRRPLAEGVDDEAVRAKKLEDLVRSQPELADRGGRILEGQAHVRAGAHRGRHPLADGGLVALHVDLDKAHRGFDAALAGE